MTGPLGRGAVLAAALFFCLRGWQAGAEPMTPEHPLLIGTGPVVGIYFPAGGAICNMVNHAAQRLVCAVVSTEGSAANLKLLKAKAIDVAVVQSDWQYYAIHASDRAPPETRLDSLRALFSLHGEPITIVARNDAGIATAADLKGKRVNLGPAGSPGRAAAEALMVALGIGTKDLKELGELGPENQPAALCRGDIDAYIVPTAHPSGIVAAATETCGAHLVAVTGVPAEQLVADNPFYAFATIPGGTYSGNPDPIPSFGLRATLVTRADLDADIVYRLVKAVFDDFPAFVAQHPAFAGLEPAAMARDGNTAPLHDGALRYYKERGWR
jgi:uncharacterized protein